MKRLFSILLTSVAVLSVACGGGKDTTKTPRMTSGLDTMSYVVGLNIGLNLIEMDSTLNIDMVCEGIRNAYANQPKLNDEEARTAFLKYMNYDNYERIKAYENRFLEDLRKQDRKFVATATGVTYKITELGDLKSAIRSTRDTIRLQCRILNSAGHVVDTAYYRNDTLRLAVSDMPRGVQEAARLIGKGGHIEAWIPSALAYGADGCDSLSVEPNMLLYYELKLVDVERKDNNARRR